MDKISISKSILSITSPGTYLKADGDELAIKVTCETNDEMAGICAKHPTRFGFFASLPLPNVEGSLKEIDRALELGAAGFAIMTNAQGYYPGDSKLDPVFAKLNERKAVIFMHPTECCTPGHAGVPKALDQYPTPMMEYFFDTTRAVVNLLLTGTVDRYQDLTFLVSHCGATIPPLVERFTAFSTQILGQKDSPSSAQVKKLFRTRFYFDLAGFPFPDLIKGYLTFGEPGRLLYGSDFPYTPEKATILLSEKMDEGLRELFDEEIIKNIYSGNAKEILNM
jgi:predicted TIM-barrel fold metal-dependent hydrolase